MLTNAQETLDSVVLLFGYLVDKDEFEEISRKALCRRLLNTATPFNENWERLFVAKLKVSLTVIDQETDIQFLGSPR